MSIVEQARAFATQAHRDQRRKGTDTPYVVHPEAVAALVAEHGGDAEVVAAAWLHDVIEDSGVSEVELRSRFGNRVASLVVAVTEHDRTLRWEQRKADVLARATSAVPEVALLKACDALANARDVLTDLTSDGQAAFERFSRGRTLQLWWYCSLASTLAPRLAASPALVEELRTTVDAICFAALRRPRESELDRVLDLTDRLFDPPATPPPDYDRDAARERARWWLADDARTLIVVDSDGGPELLGYIAAVVDIESIRFGRRAWVEDLVVETTVRSHGHGAALMGAARHWARLRACSHLELDTGHQRDAAQRFYAREGGYSGSLVYAWPLRPV